MSENILDRYQAYRTRRYLKHEARYAGTLPSWRSRPRRRLLVSVLVAALVYLTAASVFVLFGPEWSPILWVPGALVMIVSWTMLQHVSGRRGDAPADALDEWDLERRNAARSIGFTMTQGLTMIPVFLLIWGNNVTEDPRLALGGGFLAATALIAGSCTPGIILAWTTPDPEPDDLIATAQEGIA